MTKSQPEAIWIKLKLEKRPLMTGFKKKCVDKVNWLGWSVNIVPLSAVCNHSLSLCLSAFFFSPSSLEKSAPDRIWAHTWICILREFLTLEPRVVSIRDIWKDWGRQEGSPSGPTVVLNFAYLFWLLHPKYRVLFDLRKNFPLILWKSVSLLYLFWTDIKC